MTEWYHWSHDPEEGAYDILDAPKPNTHWVYFFMDLDRNAIKIGYSRDPMRRIEQLSTGCSSSLTPLMFIEATRSFETSLHRQFRQHRIKGEWFEAQPVLRYLEREFSWPQAPSTTPEVSPGDFC